MKNQKVRIFCDFDGTITLKDTGNLFFIEFGTIEPFLTQFLNKELNIKEYWRKVCKTITGKIDEQKLIEFCNNREIDSNFKFFLSFCNENEYEILILSDGFSEYIQKIFKKEKIGVNYKSNYLDFNYGEYLPIFPGEVENCDCLCASCKRNYLLNHSENDDICIYIGDGLSDYCAATHCDIIFAKSSLARYCNENKIPHHPFSNFYDIIRILKSLVKNNKLKKRNQASVLRKKAYEYE